jgi:ubiquinone/menaquinone biosynthesis C-methylase UbiE
MDKKNTWDLIWNERGEGFPIDDAMAINGFDQAFGTINASNFQYLVEDIQHKLNLVPTDIVLEAGCGAGALMNALSSECAEIQGTDLSPQMVARAQKLYPSLKAIAADPRRLPYPDRCFTKIYVHSVFQYFPDYEYAKAVLNEFTRVAKKGAVILIADLMDLRKKEDYLNYRNSLPGSTVIWKSSVSGPAEHLYYDPSFFAQFESSFTVEIMNREIPNYENGKYRFDVRLKKI